MPPLDEKSTTQSGKVIIDMERRKRVMSRTKQIFVLLSCIVVTLFLILCLTAQLSPKDQPYNYKYNDCSPRIMRKRDVAIPKSRAKEEEKFTILTQTLRNDDLMKFLSHYTKIPELDRVVVVMRNDTTEQIPDGLDLMSRVVFVIVPQTVEITIQRFTEIRTEGMIMVYNK